MIQELQISPTGLKAIADREGMRLTAYRCPAGVWTIGAGHTGKDVRPGMTITAEKAAELLRADARGVEDYLNRQGLELTQYEFDALGSFIFNIGALKFSNSTMLRFLRERRHPLQIAAQFMRWIYITKPNGEKTILQGLARRRYSEGLQFLAYPPQLHVLGYPEPLPPAKFDLLDIRAAIGHDPDVKEHK